jgi:hypothetical protein
VICLLPSVLCQYYVCNAIHYGALSSLLAPYPMDSFFGSFFKNVQSIELGLL